MWTPEDRCGSLVGQVVVAGGRGCLADERGAERVGRGARGSPSGGGSARPCVGGVLLMSVRACRCEDPRCVGWLLRGCRSTLNAQGERVARRERYSREGYRNSIVACCSAFEAIIKISTIISILPFLQHVPIPVLLHRSVAHGAHER